MRKLKRIEPEHKEKYDAEIIALATSMSQRIMDFVVSEAEKFQYSEDARIFTIELGKSFGGMCYMIDELNAQNGETPDLLNGKDAILPVAPRVGYDQLKFGGEPGDTH